MKKDTNAEFWRAILGELDEKLQYGMLEQTKNVLSASMDGTELLLEVNSPEAFEYFQSEVNQQRLCILSRRVIQIEKVVVTLVSMDDLY